MEADGLSRVRALQARPNRLMVMVADEEMGLEGRLVTAAEAMPEPKGVPKTDLIRLRALRECMLSATRRGAHPQSVADTVAETANGSGDV